MVNERQQRIAALREKVEQLRLLIDAHETLIEVEPENRARFAAVVADLREDLTNVLQALRELEADTAAPDDTER